MFEGLLIHPKTRKALDNFIAEPTHALLLVGPRGMGKATLARHTAAAILGIKPDELSNYPHFSHLQREKDKRSISIEAIRRVNKTLQLQVPGNQPIRRVVIIEDAHYMNAEAQNAFLKSLEEPPADTVFILTVSAKSNLLPTITSRSAALSVHPIAQDALPDHSAENVAAWRLSQGAPGTLSSLLNDEQEDLKLAIDKAKDFVKMSEYQRLVELDGLSKDKEQLGLLIEGLARVVQALYRAAAARNNQRQVDKLLKAMEEVSAARQNLEANVLPRLVVLRLAVNFNI